MEGREENKLMDPKTGAKKHESNCLIFAVVSFGSFSPGDQKQV